jgi:hypothetical protein
METVIDRVTGRIFHEYSLPLFIQLIKEFNSVDYDSATIQAHARLFNKQYFQDRIKQAVESGFNQFKQMNNI